MPVTLIKPEQFTIGLPRERGVQLHAIAAARGTTVVSVVEEMIARSVEAGEISDELKGLGEMVADDDTLFVTIRGTGLPGLDRAKAMTIAALLDLAAGRSVPGLDFKIETDANNVLDLGHGFKMNVIRHSRAVLIAVAKGDTVMKTATTPSIAADFARLLRKHASTLTMSLSEIEASMSKAA